MLSITILVKMSAILRINMSKSVLFWCALFLFFSYSHAQDLSQYCSSYKFQHKTFESCLDLHVLNSSIYWTYNNSSRVIDVAFRMVVKTKNRWVAWGINPTSKGMVGCETFVGLKQSDGSVKAYTTPIKSYGTKLEPGNLSFKVYGVSAMANEDEMIIFAKFELPVNATSVNHLWQEGPVINDNPGMHALRGPNVKSFGTVNFMSGKSMAELATKDSRAKLKIIHGVINTISWGIMMPVGVIIARYVKVFPSADPAWFYLHLSCQITAFFMGISGGVMGFVLGKKSPGIQYSSHKYIGIALFALASLQVLAMCLRPDKKHKFRFYWNIYHKSTGYATIILGIINIFKGFAIMEARRWRLAYIILLAILAFVAVALEGFTWYVVLKTKCSKNGETEEISA